MTDEDVGHKKGCRDSFKTRKVVLDPQVNSGSPGQIASLVGCSSGWFAKEVRSRRSAEESRDLAYRNNPVQGKGLRWCNKNLLNMMNSNTTLMFLIFFFIIFFHKLG